MFINHIKYFREFYKMTQSELAAVIGVSKNTISSWERSEYLPNAYHCKLLCIEFNIDFDDLFQFRSTGTINGYPIYDLEADCYI